MKSRWLGATLGLAFILFASSSPPRIHAEGKKPDRIRGGEMVVRLKKGRSIAQFNARHDTSLLESLGDSDRFRLRLPLGTDTQDKVFDATRDDDVEFAQPNFEISAPEIRQSSQAFIDPASTPFVSGTAPVNFFAQNAATMLHLAQAHTVATGSGVTVAVIDTGIDLNHPLFAGRIAWSVYDFVDDDANPSEEPGLGFGHGTFISGLIALSAPQAKIMPIRAFDGNGIGTSFSVAKAIQFAAQNGARVINMSFGMFEEDPLIKDVIDHVDERLMMVAAAGNDNIDFLQYPADESDALSVTATTLNDQKAPFANFESDVSVSAPGVGLYSAYPGGSWATWEGTSFSTAFVSGEAALLFSLNPGFSRSDLNNLITTGGVRIDDLNPSFAGRLGNVRIDCWDAVTQAQRQ